MERTRRGGNNGGSSVALTSPYLKVAPARHYYVSQATGASDSNNGLTWTSAVASLDRALELVGGTTNNTNRAVIHLGYGTWGSALAPLPTYTIKGVRGFVIEGLGPELTTLWGPDAAPLIKAVNCYQFRLRNLTYAGSPSGTGWGLEMCANYNGTAFVGGVEPTQCGAENCYFGTRQASPMTAAYGVRWRLGDDYWQNDANNDQGLIRDCCFFSVATPIAIEHSNSLNHRIEGCRFDIVQGGILFKGGSATVVNANFESSASTGWMFDLQPAAGTSSLVSQNTPYYRHAITIIGTQSEAGQMGWVRSHADVTAGPTRSVSVCVSGGDFNGGGVGGANGKVIDWATTSAGSVLSFTGAQLYPRYTGGYVSAASANSTVSFTQCCMAIYDFQWAGHLDFVRCQSDRNMTLTPSGGATHNETMCVGTGFIGGTIIDGNPVFAAAQSVALPPSGAAGANMLATSLANGVSGWSAASNTTVTNNVALSDTLPALRLVSTSNGVMGATFTSASDYMPVLPNTPYSFQALFLAAATPQAVRVDTRWYDSSKVVIGNTISGPTVTDNTTTWTAARNTLVSPANAAYVSVIVRVADTSAGGETHYVRQVGVARAVADPNLMTATMATGVSGWASAANTTATNNVALSDGLPALRLVSTAGGVMGGAFSSSNDYVTVLPNTAYVFSANFLAATLAQAVRVDTIWYDSSKAVIGSTISGPTVTDNTTSWVTATNILVSPSNAAYASVTVRVANTAAGGETHYVRQIRVTPGASTFGQVPAPVLSYNRNQETVGGAQIRQALVAAGLVQDATSGTTGSLTVLYGMYAVSTLGEHVMSPLMAGTGTTSVPTVNGALAVKIRPRRNITPASLVWYSTSASGNYDIAILDSTGARLWSKGSTAWPAAGTITETVTGVTLTSGVEYWLLFAADNTTGAFRGMAGSAAGGEQAKDMSGTAALLSVPATAYPVPSTVTLGSTATGRVPLIQIRE